MSNNESELRKDRKPPSDQELETAVPRGQRRKEFRVGAFGLVGFLSVMVALFLLTDPATFRGRYHISTLVENAGGIRRGDPVRLRGVNIGTVNGFTLTPEGVLLRLELDGEWEIPADSRTRLVSSGLLGGKTVVVVEGESSEMLPPGGQIPGENMGGLTDLPPGLGEDAQQVLERIQSLLEEPTVNAVKASAQELEVLLARLSELADEQGEEIARLTASLNRSAEGLEDAAAAGDDVARAVARADSALVTVRATSASIDNATASLHTILQRMENGEGTLGQLSTNPALYETLNEAAESIRLLATDLRENPGRYVKVEIF
jgi:phospholipid/cholesterol/gamma-HCH transport system substrate-binding protein